MSRHRAPEADVDGSPRVALRDEDREDIADVLAELLLAVVADERDAGPHEDAGRVNVTGAMSPATPTTSGGGQR
jgi:hypothetical protein